GPIRKPSLKPEPEAGIDRRMDHLLEMMSTLRANIGARLEIHIYDLCRPANGQPRLSKEHVLNRFGMPGIERGAVDRAKGFVKKDLEIDTAKGRIDIAPRLDRRAGTQR